MSRTKGTLIYGSPIEMTSAAPVDAKMLVTTLADLTTEATWQAPSGAGPNAGKLFCYYGMLVYVGNDPEPSNNGLYVLENNAVDTGDGPAPLNDANVSYQYSNCWTKISQSDTRIDAIESDIDSLQETVGNNTTAINGKLFADFGSTNYSAGTLQDNTVIPARTDATSGAQNVYITGQQIQEYAAAAVNDKGVFSTSEELNQAYPTPEDGWYATVLETGTIWTAQDGAWSNSGESSGVTSVNGMSGIVTLTASDVDAYSKSETDTEISNAITVDTFSGLTTTSKVVQGAINELKGRADTNASGIQANSQSISQLQSSLALKQDAAITVDVQGNQQTTIPGAITALDTALTAVKATADGAAKIDASNITPSVWKGVLGYQDATDVSNKVVAGITTDEWEVTTTAKTVEGAINELDSDLGTLNTTVSGLQSTVTGLGTNKQNVNVTIDGLDATTVEGALTEITGDVATLTSTVANKANTADVVLKTDISTSVPASGGVDTKVTSEKAVVDALANKADKATTLAGYGITDAQSKLNFYTETTSGRSKASITVEGSELTVDANGLGGNLIDTSISDSSTNNHVPGSLAVYNAIQQVKTDLGSALVYKGTVDTYEELPAENNSIGDTYNVVAAHDNYPAGTNYAWTGTAWDALGGSIDLSGYQMKTDNTLATTDKTVVGAINEINTALATKEDALNFYAETTNSFTLGDQGSDTCTSGTIDAGASKVSFATSGAVSVNAGTGFISYGFASNVTTQTGTITVPSEISAQNYRVVIDTVATAGKSRTVFNVEGSTVYAELLYGTAASITDIADGVISYNLGVANATSANIAVVMI